MPILAGHASLRHQISRAQILKPDLKLHLWKFAALIGHDVLV